MTEPATLRSHCVAILTNGALSAKLAAPRGGITMLDDSEPGGALSLAAPARAPEIRLRDGAETLPRPGSLRDPDARATCLARFAHHELMAVELFAWALLRWPEMNAGLRRELARVLADEQQHCQLYLERLADHESSLGKHTLSGYFWRHIPAIDASPAGPAAFLAAMGLTLEQANLDFTLVYRDAFRECGDEASARVCQRVHDDEVRHVRVAAEWLRELREEPDDVARYQACVPWPLGPARAKGRRFDVAARRRAGLETCLIECVETARSTQELAASDRRRR